MSARQSQIGFTQRVRLEWLERTGRLLLAGNEEDSIKKALEDLLHEKVSVGGNARASNREKTIGVLMRVWVRPPKEIQPLRDDGLRLLSETRAEMHLALHWGMAMAVYPFFGAVAAHVGRLIKLQGTARTREVQRRLREHYGERETVSRAARRVLRSFGDWGVLQDTSKRGVYAPATTLAVDQQELVAWLTEAFLHAHEGRAMEVGRIWGAPAFFPFQLSPFPADSLASVRARLQVFRHGLDGEMLSIACEHHAAAKRPGFSS